MTLLEEYKASYAYWKARAADAEGALREIGDVHRRWESGGIDDSAAIYAIDALIHVRAALEKK